MAVRLDCIKKLLAIFYYERSRFEKIEPEIENIIDSIDVRYKIGKIIDE